MKLHNAFGVLVLLAAAPAAAQQPAAARAPVVDARIARADSIFDRFSGTKGPGCAVGVRQDGRSLLSRAYGMADLEHDQPNRPATIFEAGSVSKQFTAAAIVLLAQDGKLSLDDDIRKYVPELPDYGTPITIRHLLTHTSGLRDWGSVAAIGGWPRGTRTYTHAHVLDIARRQTALNYPPGTYYSYTNTGYNLLVMIAERVSGVPFPEFSRTRLFEPLGMTSTQWRDDYRRIVKGRAVAYSPLQGGGFRMNMPFENVYGNGGLLTTVGDLLLWTENLRTGRVGGPRFIQEMHRQGRLTSGRRLDYASGLVVSRYRGLREVSHGGATAGYRAYLAHYPDQKLGVAVLCNAANANGGTLAHQVADLYLEGAERSERATSGGSEASVSLDAAALAARAGLYRDTRTGGVVRLEVRGSQLAVADGPPLTARSPTSFEAGPDTRLEFQAAARPGGRAAFDRISEDGDTLRYEPTEPFAPTSQQLAEYAGTYHSDEADATYSVAVADGRLVLRDAVGEATQLTPIYRDVFGADGQTIRFSRDDSGRVVRMDAVASRVWALPFHRRP